MAGRSVVSLYANANSVGRQAQMSKDSDNHRRIFDGGDDKFLNQSSPPQSEFQKEPLTVLDLWWDPPRSGLYTSA